MQFVYVRGSGRNGITIDGGRFNSVNGFIGVFDDFTASCVSGAANAQHGVALLNGAYFNSVQSSNIGCSGGASVDVNGTGTDNNTIRGNTIGTNNTGSGVIMNTTGVLIESGAQFNQVITNTIANSAQDGVWLTGINTRDNAVYGNTIRNNGFSGVEISGGALFNTIGADAVSPSSVSGNVIISNTLEGVYISGNTTANNAVYANRIGVNAAGTAANGNGSHGVSVINQAHDNLIGASDTTGNIIAANGGNGININNAYNNIVAGNRIGTNALGTASLPNAVNGVALVNGAHDNTVGGATAAERNLIGGNAQHGVLLDGSTTATNTVTFNDIGYNTLTPLALVPNGFDGIALSNGTFNNTLGGIGVPNIIYTNNHNGIGLASGAHDNHINANSTAVNGRYGVLFDGGGTTGNVISRTQIFLNNYDGIGEKNGAGGNVWSETSIYSNGGLGIDKNIVSDVANTPNPPYLFITSVNLGVVQGRANGSSGFLLTKVELYRIALDPSGFGEGFTFVGSAVTNPAGSFGRLPTPRRPAAATRRTRLMKIRSRARASRASSAAAAVPCSCR